MPGRRVPKEPLSCRSPADPSTTEMFSRDERPDVAHPVWPSARRISTTCHDLRPSELPSPAGPSPPCRAGIGVDLFDSSFTFSAKGGALERIAVAIEAWILVRCRRGRHSEPA
jgi:hypothetical protein